MAKKMLNEEYDKMLKAYSPNSPLWFDTLKAFIVGGLVCVLGQALKDFFVCQGAGTDAAFTAASVSLIFIAAALTALNLFEKIAIFAGAGTLVPITGFSNAVVSPAMEFRADGMVMGVGAKMFVVAGPVIVYGTVSSFIAGLIYYFFLR